MSEIELHRKLLGDRVRNRAIERALKKVIQPGKTTVADIGAGTGYISFLARQLGARSCDLYEYSPALALARRLAVRNKIDGLRFIQAHSTEVENPHKVDVVFSETLGNYALEENLLETLVDARRFLRPGGVILPCALRQFVAPVITPWLQDEIDVWTKVDRKLDFSEARKLSLNNMYVKSIRPGDLGDSDASTRSWDNLVLTADHDIPSSVRESTVRWSRRELASPNIYGFALWWEADLVPGVKLSTAPFAPKTHWEQVYLPLLNTIKVREGDNVELKLTSDTRPEIGVNVAWDVRHSRANKSLSRQSLNLLDGHL